MIGNVGVANLLSLTSVFLLSTWIGCFCCVADDDGCKTWVFLLAVYIELWFY